MQCKYKLAYFAIGSVLVLCVTMFMVGVQAQAPRQAQIAFESSRDDDEPGSEKASFEIYVMYANGTMPENLTKHDANDLSPSWSPDGRKIAFSTNRDENFEIYVMNANGEKLRNLTNNDAADGSPAWSPDGQRIAFESDRDGRSDIYVMDTNGQNLQNLTNQPGKDDRSPSWSRDGKKIAFESRRDGNWEIYVMDADGQNTRRLTERPDNDLDPSWSPDGQRIAFARREKGIWNIYIMDANGQNPQNLTKNRVANVEYRSPSWSPVGQSIAFKSDIERRGGVVVAWTEIFVMNASGAGNPKNLTQKHQADGRDGAPDWFDPNFIFAVSPAGKRVTIWGWLKQVVPK